MIAPAKSDCHDEALSKMARVERKVVSEWPVNYCIIIYNNKAGSSQMAPAHRSCLCDTGYLLLQATS